MSAAPQSETFASKVNAATSTVTARLDTARATTWDIANGLNAGRRAYVEGMYELGRMLFGFGKEVVDDSVNHVRATVKARNLREVAELQAAFAQHRVESAAAHMQQFVEVARDKTENMLAPITGLVKRDDVA